MRETLYLDRDGVPACAEAAGDVLRRGGLVAAPTDTVYGLLAGFDPEAAERLYRVKGRDQEKRLLALVPDVTGAAALSGRPLPPFVSRFWPGPLTLILPAGPDHPLGWETQAVRVPDSEWLLALLLSVGGPVFAPSANPQGQPPAVTVGEALAYFGDSADLYIGKKEREEPDSGLPSTIVGWTEGAWRILREGALPADQLQDGLM